MSNRTVDISICIATYNSEPTLRVCLDSIFQQSVEPREVLVCDGGSKDGTLEILRDYPVRLVARGVKGIGSARNILTSAASGKIIAWIDSDVVIPINWLEAMEKLHEENSKIDSLSNLMRLVEIKEAKERYSVPISLENIVLTPINVRERKISQSALTIKKDVIMRAGGYDPLFEWGEEWDLKIRLSGIDAKLYRIEASLAYHLRSERFLNWSEKLLLHNLTLRDLIFAGNFICFFFKYGPWYIRNNPRHFFSFLLRIWLFYSLLMMIILPITALISLLFTTIANLVACKIQHKRLRLGFLFDQFLKALGEHRNLFRSINHRILKPDSEYER